MLCTAELCAGFVAVSKCMPVAEAFKHPTLLPLTEVLVMMPDGVLLRFVVPDQCIVFSGSGQFSPRLQQRHAIHEL